ncbi:MAG TPA: hypothetical protein ENK18_27770 [Deltaproteobacteria bacterium]|nr:hypothetical protein [Deltaproteobacteria bacterium]
MSCLSRWSLSLLVACASQRGTAAAPEAPTALSPEAAQPQGLAPVPEILATIGGEPVTRAELMAFAAPEIIEAELAAHEARSNAIEALIMQRLIEAESDRLGIAPEDLIKREVDDKTPPPTDEEVESFYRDNEARMPGSLEEMRPQLVGYLHQERATELLRALVHELEAESGVVRLLEPYRVSVDAEDSPRWGNPAAPVQIVAFSDFQCPYCSEGARTVQQIKDKYGKDKVSIVYRHFPLPSHPQAASAAAASECAHEQGAFWAFHDALFAAPMAWSDDDYVRLATDVGVKKKPFKECLASNRHAATVEDDVQDGRRAGMSGTPGFYINGVVLTGAQPISVFSEIIDRELARVTP